MRKSLSLGRSDLFHPADSTAPESGKYVQGKWVNNNGGPPIAAQKTLPPLKSVAAKKAARIATPNAKTTSAEATVKSRKRKAKALAADPQEPHNGFFAAPRTMFGMDNGEFKFGGKMMKAMAAQLTPERKEAVFG